MTHTNLAVVQDDRALPQTTADPDSTKGVALRQMLRPISRYLSDDEVREITIPRPGLLFVRIKGAWHEKSAPE